MSDLTNPPDVCIGSDPRLGCPYGGIDPVTGYPYGDKPRESTVEDGILFISYHCDRCLEIYKNKYSNGVDDRAGKP